MIDLFLTNTQPFASQDVNWSNGVVLYYCNVLSAVEDICVSSLTLELAQDCWIRLLCLRMLDHFGSRSWTSERVCCVSGTAEGFYWASWTLLAQFLVLSTALCTETNSYSSRSYMPAFSIDMDWPCVMALPVSTKHSCNLQICLISPYI